MTINKKEFVISVLRGCGFELMDYLVTDEGKVEIVKTPEWHSPTEDEGRGFNVVFNLAQALFYNKDLVLMEKDFKPYLHPILWHTLKTHLEKIGEPSCIYLSPEDVREYLKCTVAPSNDCDSCPFFTSNNPRILIVIPEKDELIEEFINRKRNKNE